MWCYLVRPERSILSNNRQVLCRGEQVTSPEFADRVVGQWLGYTLDPSARKVSVVTGFEESGS